MKLFRNATLVILAALVLMFGSVQMASAVDVQLNLRATWTANGESDMLGYHLFFQSGAYWKGYQENGTFDTVISTYKLLPLTPTILNFLSVPVPNPSNGTMHFAMTALDTNLNESARCPDALYAYNVDTQAPISPSGLVIIKP